MPVDLDAGIGTASDVALAMELGCAAVLVRVRYHQGGRPRADGRGDGPAVEAGLRRQRGLRIPRRWHAVASSPARRPRMSAIPRVLTIASSDLGGGAGIQADLKAFARCGAHGMSAIVALTAQNTLGVTAIEQLLPRRPGADQSGTRAHRAGAAKTGMLFSSPLIEAVADELSGRGIPLVVDPVMMASSGARLLLPDAVATLTGRLFPLATVVTPNLLEAQALTGLDTEDRAKLAEHLVEMGGGRGARHRRPRGAARGPPLRRAESPLYPGPAL